MELMRLGKQAKATLMHVNMRLVLSIAKRYTGFGLPLSDLLEVGDMQRNEASRMPPLPAHAHGAVSPYTTRALLTDTLIPHTAC